MNMLQGHGDNAYLYNKQIVADFSSNVYFKGPSEELILHLKNRLNRIVNYPEVAAESLAKKIADNHGLQFENILVTNGATEAFYLLALLFRKSSSGIFIPSFAEYSDACNLHEHQINYINNKQLHKKYKSPDKLIWLCNPNNPDGRILSRESIKQLVTHNKDSYVIVDEAYIDFTLRSISLAEKVNHYKNLIIVRSLTKKYAIPGLRLGYIIAPRTIIAGLMKLKEPWSVNTMAIEAGTFLVSQNNSFFDLKDLIRLSQSLQEKLSRINGIEVIKSETSFFLLKIQKSALQTTDYMANKCGLLVRNASNFQELDDSYIRIGTQSENDNKKLFDALKKWMTL